MEDEVRGAFPNLPPTHEVAQAVRSPLAFLDRLADEHERAMSDDETDTDVTPVTAGTEAGPAPPADVGPAGNGSAAHNGSVGANGSGAGVSPPGSVAAGSDADALARRGFPTLPDDPNMN